MASESVRDPDGRVVELSDERCPIVDPDNGHPELSAFRHEILRAVHAPHLRLDGRRPTEEWFYLREVGPSRWLKVIVFYDRPVGRIITAFARRRLP